MMLLYECLRARLEAGLPCKDAGAITREARWAVRGSRAEVGC